MADVTFPLSVGGVKRLKDMGDGTYAEVVNSVAYNITGKFREAFEAYDPINGGRWAESKASGDLVFVDGNAAAASYLVISKDPLTAGTETYIEQLEALHFHMPTEIAVACSMSQRTLGQEFSIEAVDTSPQLADIPDIAISSITQTTTTLTIDTVAPHGLSVGKSIGVMGCSNPAANFPSLVVASVPSPTQLTCTAGPGGTIASQTITNPAGAKGSIYFRQRLGRANNGVALIFENTTVTNASIYLRSESGDALPSGTIAGSHATTVGTTAPIQLVNSAYQYAFGATTEYRMLLQSDRVQIVDAGVDATAQLTARATRTQVCPDPDESYKLRFRSTNNKALTVPVAQIVSAAKTASTTVTITTDRDHGLVLGDPVVIYGIRDQTATSFPNLLTATAVASIVSPTSFTIVQGTSGTATSFGGYVAKVNGGNLMSSLGGNAVVAQTAVLSTLSDGTRQLVLTGNTNWSGLSIGDLVEIIGCRNATDGATVGVDGPWKVANAATTTLTLVLPFTDQRVLPADFGSVNCGGGIIKRTDLRISFVRVFDYERLRVEALGRPTSDAASAMPVTVQNSVAVTMTSTGVAGTVAQDAAIGNPVTAGGRASNANPTAMSATGDSVANLSTMIGASVVRPYSIPEADWTYTGTLTTNADTAAKAAAGAGVKNYCTAIQVQNTHASVATTFIIKDGTTARFTINLPAAMTAPVDIEFPTPIPTAANAILNVACGTTGSNVLVNAQGYFAP